MIIYITINLETLQQLEKKYKWEKPKCCPFCKHKLWGHGYVSAYFTEVRTVLYLKRYRCNFCKKIITIKPKGYCRYIRSKIEDIYTAIRMRLTSYKWPHDQKRQRCGHWLHRFLLYCKQLNLKNLVNALDEFQANGQMFLIKASK